MNRLDYIMYALTAYFKTKVVDYFLGCDIDSFSCLDWETGREESTCVPLSKRCDNKVDCRNQKDEMECALLSDTVVPQKVTEYIILSDNYYSFCSY